MLLCFDCVPCEPFSCYEGASFDRGVLSVGLMVKSLWSNFEPILLEVPNFMTQLNELKCDSKMHHPGSGSRRGEAASVPRSGRLTKFTRYPIISTRNPKGRSQFEDYDILWKTLGLTELCFDLNHALYWSYIGLNHHICYQPQVSVRVFNIFYSSGECRSAWKLLMTTTCPNKPVPGLLVMYISKVNRYAMVAFMWHSDQVVGGLKP